LGTNVFNVAKKAQEQSVAQGTKLNINEKEF